MRQILLISFLLFSCHNTSKIDFVSLSSLTETYSVLNGSEELVRRNDYYLVDYGMNKEKAISLLEEKADSLGSIFKDKYNHYTVSFYNASIIYKKKYLENNPNNISIKDLEEEKVIKYFEWDNGKRSY